MKKIKKMFLSLYVSLCTIIGTTLPVSANNGILLTGGVSLDSVLTLISRFVQIGGALWLLWGVVILGTGLKDHNGPGIQSGVWQIVGGGLILAGGVLFTNISTG